MAHNLGHASIFRNAHGPSINAMAFRVRVAATALRLAVVRGAKQMVGTVGPMELNVPAIEGIGGSYLYLVDRHGDNEIYHVEFITIPGSVERERTESAGLRYISERGILIDGSPNKGQGLLLRMIEIAAVARRNSVS
jgi:4-hydroxyphenylpyruvate dioxygenase